MNKGVDDPVDYLLVGVLATTITVRQQEASVGSNFCIAKLSSEIISM